MIRIFTRRWGIGLHIFLACLLCNGYEAESKHCGGGHEHSVDHPPAPAPHIIILPGSTFTAEKITIETSNNRQDGRHKITFGNTVLSYKDTKKCWFHHNSKKCLSQEVADKSKGGGSYHVAIKVNGREIGVVELDDKSGKLHAYSISAAGQKDPQKPYLEFHEQPVPATKGVLRYKLTVSAYDRGRLIGTYESLSDNIALSLGPQAKKGQPLNLRGKKVSSKNGKIDMKPL